MLENVALQLRLGGRGGAGGPRAGPEALDAVGVGHLAARDVVELSGGEAQRVAVAAALAHRPVLVLADEPSGELDTVPRGPRLRRAVGRGRGAGAALVLVSHDRRAGRIADRVVRIRDGRLSETWRPGEEELLVVDDRGWLRLPEALRPDTDAVRAVRAGDAVTLTPGATGPTPATAAGAGPASVARPAAPVAEPVASLKAVTKAYGERVVLAGLDLDVPGAALTVVRGRSGAGKSTLLRVLVGLERPDAGRVEAGRPRPDQLDRARWPGYAGSTRPWWGSRCTWRRRPTP